MRFSTALRDGARRRLERMGSADLMVGIPCFNNENTIAHVVKTVEDGLTRHYPQLRSVVVVADGGSVDDSREEAELVEKSPWLERLVTIYRGVPGKGSAVRAIFEAANLLEVNACAIFDSDLRSITPDWVALLIEPILKDNFEFIAPYYKRYKYDGTITNNIVYNLTRALYGYRVRQPIGGDFAFSLPLIRKYISQNVWETDVGRFGIDIWLTTTAMVENVRIAQANLGVKIHDVKDPAEALGPMFRQVVSTLFQLMEQHEMVWKRVEGSQPVPIVGPQLAVEPQPFAISVEKLVDDFKLGFSNYGELWKKIVMPENFAVIQDLAGKPVEEFMFPVKYWARILYDLAVAYHHWKNNRQLLIGLMTPLYFARIASFVNRTKQMTNDEAEQVVEHQAQVFEEMKNYLIQRWDETSD